MNTMQDLGKYLETKVHKINREVNTMNKNLVKLCQQNKVVLESKSYSEFKDNQYFWTITVEYGNEDLIEHVEGLIYNLEHITHETTDYGSGLVYFNVNFI